MFNVTLKALRQAGACFSGYNKLVRSLGGKGAATNDWYILFKHTAPISIEHILASNGLADALWALRCVQGHDRDVRHFAVWCVRQVAHLLADHRSIAALDVVERFTNGEASPEELTATRAARAAAYAAACAACAAYAAHAAADDAADAAYAAYAARAAQQDMLLKMIRGEAPWQ